jgi:transglutaminase-like putative cysteine protease
VTWTPCAHDCDAAVEAPLDFMGRLVVRSPVRIPEWFKHRALRFVLTRSDGAPVQIAATDEQAVVVGKQNAAILTICADCGAAEHPSPEELARYLTPNAWVQSDNAEIRALARNTVSPSMPVDVRMHKLERLVKQRMRGSNDFLGFGSALDALHTGSGDCTEFSVLLAAFARSQGIPTRIAMGMAYSDRFSGKKDVFSPHVWVQAWDGKRWTSYDAGLDGFDSTHIALAVGSGEPDELQVTTAELPLLHMENAGVVRSH